MDERVKQMRVRLISTRLILQARFTYLGMFCAAVLCAAFGYLVVTRTMGVSHLSEREFLTLTPSTLAAIVFVVRFTAKRTWGAASELNGNGGAR